VTVIRLHGGEQEELELSEENVIKLFTVVIDECL
jgi:hypothetical protein